MESSIFSTEINFTGILTSMKMITPSLQYTSERSKDNYMWKQLRRKGKLIFLTILPLRNANLVLPVILINFTSVSRKVGTRTEKEKQ